MDTDARDVEAIFDTARKIQDGRERLAYLDEACADDRELQGSVEGLLKYDSGVLSVALAPEGKILASGSADGTVKLWHVPTGDELATLKAHASIVPVAFFPDGDTLAAGGTDKSVTLWHVNAEKEALRAKDD